MRGPKKIVEYFIGFCSISSSSNEEILMKSLMNVAQQSVFRIYSCNRFANFIYRCLTFGSLNLALTRIWTQSQRGRLKGRIVYIGSIRAYIKGWRIWASPQVSRSLSVKPWRPDNLSLRRVPDARLIRSSLITSYEKFPRKQNTVSYYTFIFLQVA